MAISEAEYEAMEGFESESEAAERRAPFRRPSPTPSFRPRPAPTTTPMYVTQPQLEAALTRVDGKIKTVTDSSAAVNARVASLQASFRKESEERKKTVDTQSKDLNQKVQLRALLPLLLRPPTAAGPNVGGAALTDSAGIAIPSVSVPSTGGLDAVLPLLLVSGLGGSGGSGGGLLGGGDGSGGSDSSLILLALVLGSQRP
jgi:hypothetical protein